jgi:hypothetical protein
MCETQWPHTLHISLNQQKQDSLVFQTGVSVFPVATIFQILDVSVFKTECSNFYELVLNG